MTGMNSTNLQEFPLLQKNSLTEAFHLGINFLTINKVASAVELCPRVILLESCIRETTVYV